MKETFGEVIFYLFAAFLIVGLLWLFKQVSFDMDKALWWWILLKDKQ